MARKDDQTHSDPQPAEPSAGPAPRQPIELPIVEVTLLEDRARVRRRGEVELAAGFVKLAMAAVAPVVSDRTLVARVAGGGAGVRVAEARVRRQMVTRRTDGSPASEGSVADLEQRLVQLDAEINDLEARARILSRTADHLAEVAELCLTELSQDVAHNQSIGSDRDEALDDVWDKQRDHQRERLEVTDELTLARANRQRLHHRLEVLKNPASEATGVVELELSVTSAGTYELEVEYVVPNACWRPHHRARLTTGEEAAVELSTDATVWQNTGEDWAKVQLVFSTERASLGTEPPELDTDRLQVARKGPGVQVETREQTIRDVGLGGEGVTTASELPGIDDGGEVVCLRAPAEASVPSDGRPHRVALSTFVSPASCELVSYPELSPCVLLRTTLTNRSSHPILAGPVDLIRRSGLCGRTSVLFVAPGETMELGWGPDAELRVKRTDEVSDEDRGMLSSWSSRNHHVEVRLSNLGAGAKAVRVRERVPVAEIEKVKIAANVEGTSRGKTPDGDGFVDWEVKLRPFGQETLDLRYTLTKHQDVLGI
ncbi:MAG: DUF4139 domain-containing protein [Deltaproteobacteria bacterium]|nr:DUF4139 domain-containing protein [Deltaproteobacteria bacterium]